MHRKTPSCTYSSVRSAVSGIHRGSWNVCPVGTRSYCALWYCAKTPTSRSFFKVNCDMVFETLSRNFLCSTLKSIGLSCTWNGSLPHARFWLCGSLKRVLTTPRDPWTPLWGVLSQDLEGISKMESGPSLGVEWEGSQPGARRAVATISVSRLVL